ncbi:MAG: multidrug efflux system outer membrane protein, partial [Planctomycetota bacterium]
MKSLPTVLLLGLLGCTTVGPDYEAPKLLLPEQHNTDFSEFHSLLGRYQIDPLDLAVWWSAFQDPVLDELIAGAVSENLDLRQALARIAEAEAVLGVSQSLDGPRADFSGSYRRSGISKNTQFGLFPGQDRNSDDYQAALSASWELDLWGRAKRSVEAAEADLGARVEGLWSVRVSIAGQVADAYLRLREIQVRLQVAEASLEVLERSVETTRARTEAGLVQELDLLRARTELESSRASLPELRRLQASIVTELGLLCGMEPGRLNHLLTASETGAVAIPSPGARLSATVPADLLRRRPDVRTAERELAAQTARVGIATADLYPSFSIGGSLGLQSASLSDLIKDTSVTHGFGPSVSVPLFSGGGLRANIAAADARVEQALINYESNVLLALHEVDRAATGIQYEASRLSALGGAAA